MKYVVISLALMAIASEALQLTGNSSANHVSIKNNSGPANQKRSLHVDFSFKIDVHVTNDVVVDNSSKPELPGSSNSTDSGEDATPAKPDVPGGSNSTDDGEDIPSVKPDVPGGNNSTDDGEDIPPVTPDNPGGSNSTDDGGDIPPVTPDNPGSSNSTDDGGNIPTPDNPDGSNSTDSSDDVNPGEFLVKSIEDLAEVPNQKNIIVRDLEVPAGVILDFKLKKGAKLTFAGNVTFGFKPWSGPLVQVRGSQVTVIGAPGNLLDGGGKRWWDGKGEHGKVKKPKFFFVRLKDSTISGLNVKNTPMHGFSVNSCVNVTIENIVFNNSEGACPLGGHNTDAFDVGSSDGIIIRNSVVYNQDDCLAINSGYNIVFENNFCSGGHGISIGSVGGRKLNTVENVIMKNNTVADSDNGIRIKTVKNTIGSVTNITFLDIALENIRKVGVTIQGNYINGGPKGDPSPGVPISHMRMINIHGNVLRKGTNYHIWVANATDWTLATNITGGTKLKPCQGFPEGVEILC